MTIYTTLVNAGLPVIYADESGSIIMGQMTDAQQATFNDLTLQYFNNTQYQIVIANRTYVSAIKSAYTDMTTRLEQIQNSGTIPFTSAGFAQVVQAVKDESLYIERIMKFLQNLIS